MRVVTCRVLFKLDMPPSLANRLLFHTSPPPPQIFSSQNLQGTELTAEIYDFLALALRAYISPWWSKITRYDRDLLPQTAHILIHVIRTLESRCSKVDWPKLVFHDVPAILTQHYRDFRSAQAKVGTSYAHGGAVSLPELFAAIQPHMAFANGEINPEYYRQIFDRILSVCLPPEDYEPEAEGFIIREVLVNVLLVDLIPRITQPWFIHKLLLDLCDDPESPTTTITTTASSSSNLLVIALSAIQAFSGFCLALIHAYKRAIKLIHQHTKSQPQHMYILQFISELISTSEHFAPSLILAILSVLSALSFSFLLPSQSQPSQPLLDVLLPSLLVSHLSSPSFMLTTTRTTKRLLFPNGYPGPPPPVPSPEEQQLLRNRLTNIWRRQTLAATLVLGPNPTKTLESAVDPLSDPSCNSRLVVFLVDRLLGALMPELEGVDS